MDSDIPKFSTVVIILSLGISASTQQALRSVSCQVDDPTQEASISIAQSALEGTYFAMNRGPEKGWLNTADVGIKTTFIGGLADVDLASFPVTDKEPRTPCPGLMRIRAPLPHTQQIYLPCPDFTG
jgi:hypothetical protein